MIYLDNAATTWPKPEQVYQQMDFFFRNYGANPGRAGHTMAAEAGRKLFTVRETLAEFFNAKDSSEMIFTTSTTHSLNLGLLGTLKTGDHVITSALEHNSVIRPLKEMEKRGEIEISVIGLGEDEDLDLDEMQRQMKANTRMIVLSHGSNVTGHIFDIKKIGQLAKENGLLFMVDAAQTAGVFPIDVQECNIDLLAFAGHKSLYGPPGTGGLYIRKGTEVRTVFAGGTGSRSEDVYQPNVWPDKYESGTVNSVGLIGLGAGIGFIQEKKMDHIRNHELKLSRLLLKGLLDIDQIRVYGPELGKVRTPVISFNIGRESSSEVGYILDKVFGIAVRAGLHCAPLTHQALKTMNQGVVRASFGYFNTKEDVEALLQAVEKISQQVK